MIPVSIPIQQIRIFRWDVFPGWHRLSALPGRIVIVSVTKQTAAAWSGLRKHAVAAGVRGAISHTVLYGVDVDAFSKGFAQSLSFCAIDNLVDGEVSSLRMFAVQQCGPDPDFIGDLHLCSRCHGHG